MHRRPPGRDQARVVRRPLVRELRAAGERLVHGEALLVREDRAEHAMRDVGLDRAVK
jgi:hypothetical protein